MDGIFSNEISNTLQYFTFPLEVVGLTLAAIEVRFPVLARSISQVVEDAATAFEQWDIQRKSNRQEEIENASGLRKSLLTRMGSQGGMLDFEKIVAMILVATMFVSATSAIFIIFFTADFPGKSFTIDLLMLVFLISLLSLFVGSAILGSVESITIFIADFVQGRAVGTLGIIIAGFGVLGEAYQFTALMLV